MPKERNIKDPNSWDRSTGIQWSRSGGGGVAEEKWDRKRWVDGPPF